MGKARERYDVDSLRVRRYPDLYEKRICAAPGCDVEFYMRTTSRIITCSSQCSGEYARMKRKMGKKKDSCIETRRAYQRKRYRSRSLYNRVTYACKHPDCAITGRRHQRGSAIGKAHAMYEKKDHARG